MHPIIRALLDLHEVNIQRQRLVQEQKTRQARVKAAQTAWDEARAVHAAAEAERDAQSALLRQYTADVERCDATIADLRAKQLQAKSNKEYMAVLNGIEAAKSEKRLRQESLRQLGERISALEQRVAAAALAVSEKAAALEAEQQALAASTQADEAQTGLESEYQRRRAMIDAAYLDVYERLVAAHRQPLMPVDGATRATPLGTIISHNQMEQLRLGQLVLDSSTQAILYIKDE